MPLTPAQRSLQARAAAYMLHASVDRAAHTQPARTAFLARFVAAVDPEGVLHEAERRSRAELAKKAYFTRLAFLSSRARMKNDVVVDQRVVGRSIRRVRPGIPPVV